MKSLLTVMKKYWLSILCGVIALAALVASYWPTSGWYGELDKKVTERIGVNSAITGLLSKQRHKPIVSPDSDSPEPLPAFPTQDVIDRGAQAVDAVHNEADAMQKAAADVNQHLPLVPDSVPNPQPTTQYNFAKAYMNATADDPAGANLRDGHAIVYAILNAGPRPTADDVARALAEKKAQIDRERVIRIDTPNGQQEDPKSRQDANDEYATESAKLPTELQVAAAKRYSCYLEPLAFTWDKTIVTSGNNPPTADKIWDAQVGLWEAVDFADAIAKVNAERSDPGSTNDHPPDVLHAVVKQIERFDYTGTNAQVNQQTGGGMPAYVVSGNAADLTTGADGAAALPKAPTASVSGRVCNGMYDVLRYTATIIIDARKLPDVIQYLQKNQFVTVLTVQAAAVDPANAAKDGFYYGDAPCIRVTLECEELMMQSWTKDLMPRTQRDLLATMAGSQPGQPAAAPGGYPGMPPMGIPGMPPGYPGVPMGPPPGAMGPPPGAARP